jgi:hypothetical protein
LPSHKKLDQQDLGSHAEHHSPAAKKQPSKVLVYMQSTIASFWMTRRPSGQYKKAQTSNEKGACDIEKGPPNPQQFGEF